MFDFSVLQANADNPTLMSVVYAMLFSFLLSVVVAFTYEKTSRHFFVPGNFVQAMILGSMAATTVMLAIGDSLARGLGMIGALAIIHFRTNLRDPRNIIFMFAALATGIACGVHGYNIAFMGTISFCIVAFLLKWTPFSKSENLINVLRFRLDVEEETAEPKVRELLALHCEKHVRWRSEYLTEADGKLRLVCNYRVILKKNTSEKDFLKTLSSIGGLSKIEFTTRSEPDAL